MRTSRIMAAVAAAATAVGTAGIVAMATPGDAATTMTFIARTIQADAQDINNGSPQFGQGDGFVISETLYSSDMKSKVGYDSGFTTITHLAGSGGWGEALVTLAVPGGQLTIQGVLKFTQTGPSGVNVLAITGGTGDFAGKQGTVKVEDISDSDTKITITLQ